MNVQYLIEKPGSAVSPLGHSEAHQIIKDVAQRIKNASKENSENLIEAIKADELHDKKLDDEIKQLAQDLATKQNEYDNQVSVNAGKMIELNNAKIQINQDNEEIKMLGEAAEASTKAVKALEDELNSCKRNLEKTKKFAEMKVREEENIKKECAKAGQEASEALEAANKKTEDQRKLKEQFKQEIAVKQEECAKAGQEASKELLEKNFEIDKLAGDVKREAASVLASNKNVDILRESVNDKTDEIAKLRSKINRLLAENKELKEAPANISGIPDGKLSIKVCRPMGKGKICGAPAELEVKNGRLANPLPDAKDGAELLEVKKGKNGGYTVKAPRLKFNPVIKF